MTYRHPLTTDITKIIGSLMAIFFSLLAFAYGQNCTLLPGRNPSILIDGQSRTGYQVPEATLTQSCTGTVGTITCVSGSVAYGNIFKYPSCIPHTWANCTTPTGANHLEYRILYKLSQATYTQTCQQLSQNLQCRNGVFTGGITPNLFTYTTCTDPNRAQCVDIRTNSFRNHGDTVLGYTAILPSLGQTCTTLQKTLACTNGVWSGNGAQGQAGLFTGCTNPLSFSGCLNIRTNTMGPHGSILNAYTNPTGVCPSLLHPLTCVNGIRNGGNQSTLYSGCTNTNSNSCPNILTNNGRLPHGSIITKYTQNLAFETSNHYCSDYAKVLQCVNGTRSGNQAGLFTGCQNIVTGSCLDTHTNKWIYPFGTIYRYTGNQPTATQTCNNLRIKLTCIGGARSGGNINLSPTCGNCMLPRGPILAEGDSIYGYSTILWSTTGQNYASGCSSFSGALTCTNSILQGVLANNFPYSLAQCQAGTPKNCTNRSGGTIMHGTTITGYSTILWSVTGQNYTAGCAPWGGTLTCINGIIQGNPSKYPYTLNQCTNTLSPKNCTEWAGGIINHLQSVIGYSVTGATFPKTCDQNYSTSLNCINGILNGNWQNYSHAGCTDIGGLVSGIDLAIDESPGLPGQGNISGGLIAQGSSPQITILFKNKGTDIINQPINSPGFLTCTRTQQSLNVYSSNPITNFVLNPGTKVGINITIQPIFTEELGAKTLECTVHTSMLVGSIAGPENDTWSGTFEVVQADRFDLALSRSIGSISQNLEAAEGAKGAQGVQNFLYNKIMNVLLPLVVIIGILSAILGFYKIMFSSEDTATKEGTRYIIYGVIGIILIMSAKFIGQNLFDLLNPSSGDIKGFEIASGIYDKIIYPFIKFAIYLVLGAMFIILVSRVITFLFGSDTDAQKKAGTLIGWNVISMLIIIGAKQIVEAIYGKQAAVVKDITNLGEVGSGVLADKNIPILYQVINYALGIASLVILVIIIIQTVKLLTKPDDPAQIKNIKNSLMYMFIGILVLGAGYLIVNFAIIN